VQNNIPSLTGLRFIAAFCVLVAHALPKIIPLPNGQEPSLLYAFLGQISAEGMSLFFVLSGFVIHYNYSEQIQCGGSGLFNFFVARFARLYPLYLACLAFELLTKYSYSQTPASLSDALPYYLLMLQSWFYIPFGDNALIYQFGLMPSVAWSISTEWFFYCVYPLICFGLTRLPRISDKLRAAFVISFAAIGLVIGGSFSANSLNTYAVDHFGPVADMNTHWQDSFIRWLLYFSPYSRVFEFIIGCLCASIYMAWSSAPMTRTEQWTGVGALWAAIAVTAGLHVLYFFPTSSIHIARLQWLSMSFGFAPTIAVIIFCCARYKTLLSRQLSSKRILLCGEASYSIYLLHLPVIFAFRWEAAPFFSIRELVGDGLRFGMTMLSVIGLSLVVWSLVEVPARRYIRRFMLTAAASRIQIAALQ
jgi:peptidoglycan/LPS O-acetylase OafA/YrhL